MRSSTSRCMMAIGSLAALACGDVADIEHESSVLQIGTSRKAFAAIQPGVRPNINSFSSAQRSSLANAILNFITQPVLDEHANGHDWHHPAVGELFFSRHHEYLNQLESYLVSNGFSAFVPVPEWDPGTAIPNEFMVADPLVTQAPMDQTPNNPIPAEFGDSQLCKFADASDMAIDVEWWHDSVHGSVGGAMAFPSQAPGAPIFWLWHGLLDDMYHERTWRCDTLPAIVTAIT